MSLGKVTEHSNVSGIGLHLKWSQTFYTDGAGVPAGTVETGNCYFVTNQLLGVESFLRS